MNAIRYTLLSDGSSDRTLLPILTWLMRQHRPRQPVHAQWADLRRLEPPPQGPAESIRQAVYWYPCDVLFVHRDAETQPQDKRVSEIREAVSQSSVDVCVVPIVPVRMTEAWLLFDEDAIRRAADNPNGHVPLQLPGNTEALPDPKSALHSLLETASELPTRRLKKFRVGWRVHRVAQLIQDFGSLRVLQAFTAFEAELQSALCSLPLGTQGG